jgi:hypothetical protein
MAAVKFTRIAVRASATKVWATGLRRNTNVSLKLLKFMGKTGRLSKMRWGRAVRLRFAHMPKNT